MGGLEIGHVLSDAAHYSHYECLICQSLVDLDCLVTTVCSHCFCRTCLFEWLNRHEKNKKAAEANDGGGFAAAAASSGKTCPTCNKDLLYANHHWQQSGNSNSSNNINNNNTMMIGSDSVLVQPLEYGQPLAHRVLRRIRVACPLRHVHAVQCRWTGDYSDLSEHLLSPTAHQQQQRQRQQQQQQQQKSTSSSSTQTPSSSSSSSSSSSPNNTNNTNSIPSAGSTRTTDASTNDGDNDNNNGSRHSKGDAEPRVAGDNDDSPSQSMRQIAESYKEQANAKFASRHYGQARDLYSQALNFLAVRPASDDVGDDQNLNLLEATLCSNRAACHYALSDYDKALRDGAQALQRDPTYAKAAVRVAKSHVQLGDFGAAVTSLEGTLKHNPDSTALQTELAGTRALRKNYQNCQTYLERQEYAAAKLEAGMLLRSSKAAKVLLANAQADLGLGLVDSASRFATTVIKQNPQSIHGYLMRGQASLLSNDLVGGTNLIKQGIRLDPDSDDKGRFAAKRWIQLSNRIKQSRDDFFHRRFRVCVDTLGEVIAVCPLLPPKSVLYAVLHTERAQALLRLKEFDASLKDCALVLYHQDDYVDAWCIRFSALHGLQRHQDVLEETAALMEKWGKDNERIKQCYQKADFEVRKANRPDFYALLGISSLASETEIKKAYKQKTLQYHPDRLASNSYTDAQREEAKGKFQLLGDALEILTTEFSRQLYDEGYDLEGIKNRFEAAQRAARQHTPHGGGGGSYPHHHHHHH